MAAAFKQRPDLIFLLGDHAFPDPQKLLERVRDLNKDHAVAVNTIVFLGNGDADSDFQKFMQTLARDNGGTFKVVKESDLPASR